MLHVRLALTGLLLYLAFVPAATAQTVPSELSSGSKAKLTLLEELSHLPAGGWRYHAGDLPHGEAMDLDDSQWKQISDREEVSSDPGWFRRVIEIPASYHGYDLTGARIWFKFHFDWSGDRTQIIYFNGKRVAMGDDLEPIVLTEQAHPGDRILVAVKIMQRTRGATARGADLAIEPMPGRPSPSNLRIEALTAALLLPKTPNAPADALAQVDRALGALDVSSLDRADQRTFDASLRATHEELMKFRPALQQISFYEIGNSHIDAAWLWPVSETIDVTKRTWGTALQLMNEYPEFTFNQSSSAYNDWIATKYGAMNDDIKQRLKEGRWNIVGGMWVEPDLNMPDGESLARQLLFGKRYVQHEYGIDVRVGWNPDSFGYNWQLPQIYKQAGVDYFVTQKLSWSESNQLPLKLFWWQSPDGSKVLSYFPGDYNHENLLPSRLADEFHLTAERNPGFTEMLDLYGIGDHGGGMTRQLLDQGTHWMRPDVVAPKMIYATPQQFFARVEPKLSANSPVWNYQRIWSGFTPPSSTAEKIAIPTWNDELYLENHRGVTTSHGEHKHNLRFGEEALLNAEKYASFAWLQGAEYPSGEFENSWRKLLFNQFHDTASGTAIHPVYVEAADDFRSLFNHTRAANDTSLAAMFRNVDTTGPGVPVTLLNPLAWSRSELVDVSVQLPSLAAGVHVQDATGNLLPVQVVSQDKASSSVHLLVQAADAPSLGYTVLRALPGTHPVRSDLAVHGWALENRLLRVELDPKTGCVTSLKQKSTNFELLEPNACGNQLQTFAERTPDAWNIHRDTLEHPVPLMSVESIKLAESGPLRARVVIERSWQHSHITQEIVLDAGSPFVRFNTHIDWHEHKTLVKAAFPLAVRNDFATYEIPYGTIQRTTLRNNSWQKAQFEDAALRWADLSDNAHGLALLNDSKYGYDCAGNVLRLSLLRSPTTPDPYADQGVASFSYAAYPHAGGWKQAMVMRQAWNFNYPLLATQQAAHKGSTVAKQSFISVDGANVVISSVKKSEDRDALVLRLFEWAGEQGQVTLHLPAGAQKAWVSNLMERPEGEQLEVKGDAVSIPVRPFEIVTVQVAYPRQK